MKHQECEKELREIHREFRERMTAQTKLDFFLDGTCMGITFPFLDRHNDYIEIYVEHGDDGIVISDDDWTMIGGDKDVRREELEAFMQQFSRTVCPAGCRIKYGGKHGVFHCAATRENAADAIIAMLQFLIQLNGILEFDRCR